MNKISSCLMLNQEFEKRRAKNPFYSLRAFARDLGVGKTTIIDVINGQRKLSSRNVEIVVDRLKLSEEEAAVLRSESSHLNAASHEVVQDDDLKLIEDWHYLATLNLASLKESQCSAEWVSARLGISFEVATDTLGELIERGMIENVDGKMVRISKPLTTQTDIPSDSIVEHHRQSIEKALEALHEVPVELREFASVTYAIHPSQIKEAKSHILEFHRKLGKILKSDEAQEVYKLNIHFFPLTKERPAKEC